MQSRYWEITFLEGLPVVSSADLNQYYDCLSYIADNASSGTTSPPAKHMKEFLLPGMIKASTKQPKAPVDGAGVGFFESKEGDADEMVEEEEEDPAMQAFLDKEKQFFLNRVSSEGEEGEEEAPEEDKEVEPELNAITPIQSHVEADT